MVSTPSSPPRPALKLRWIVWGTAPGVLPFARVRGRLAFASAIVRYRLIDVEVILKRLLVYTAVLPAIAAIYVLILQTSGGFLIQTGDEHRWLIAFLATVIVLLLAEPVKEAVLSAIDRAFYRDRYDYRRALVAFVDLDAWNLLALVRTKPLLVDERRHTNERGVQRKFRR
jgi:two-component system, NtrC family, sensor kinase